jgi:hypothetical protein
MKHLLELAHLVNAHHIRHIEVLTNAPNGEESRYYKCWQGVANGKYKTREDIAKAFGLEIGDRKLDRLIDGTNERVINSLIFIQKSEQEKTYESEMLRVRFEWAKTRILSELGLRVLAVEMADKLLDDAIKLEMVILGFEIVRFIRRATLSQPQLDHYYIRASKHYYKLFEENRAEILAESLYQDLVFPMAKIKGYKRQFASIAEEAIERLKPEIEKSDRLTFRSTVAFIDILVSALNYDFESAALKAREARLFIEQKPFKNTQASIGLHVQELAALANLNRFDEVYTTSEEILSKVAIHSDRWFKVLEVRTASALRQQNWEQAWADVSAVRNSHRYQEISPVDQDTWLLNYAYLCIAAHMKKCTPPEAEATKVHQFGTNDLFAGLQLARSDKEGANFTFLTVELFFILMEGQTDVFESRVEAIRKYGQRHLFDDPARFRTKHYIRLLDLLGRHLYGTKELHQKAAPILQELRQTPGDVLDHTYEVEVVAYEEQWDWLLELL